MPHPVDLLVHRRFLLDVGVGARDVGLGLVVVVVRDEILDRVRREEALELAVELRGQRLVRRQDQRGALRLGDDVRHRERLARAGDAEQHLVALVLPHAIDQFRDRLRLVAVGRELGLQQKGDAAFGFLRPLGAVRHEHRQVAVDERMRGDHRLRRDQRLGALGALVGACENRVQGRRGRKVLGARFDLAEGWEDAAACTCPLSPSFTGRGLG